MREIHKEGTPPKSLRFMYRSKWGLPLLRILSGRFVSKLVGKYMDGRLSKHRIKKYVKKNGIDMSEYIEEDYKSFNAFFTRRIKPELRPFDMNPDSFISPCDSKVSAYRITPHSTFEIKGYVYNTQTLLRSAELAAKYEGGLCIVFRLAVTDYHRYFYLDNCEKEDNVFIKGRLHTVQPVALDARKVFAENCREYTVMHTENFGDVTQVEVGAMMVGRISNNHGKGSFSRGEEKGKFEFGGSTIVLLIEKDKLELDEEFFANTQDGNETVVKCGERIGQKKTTKQ